MKLRYPPEVLRSRLKRFQERLRSAGIDAAMIRVKSTFTYFTGVKWLRPAMLVPAEGDPTLFAAKGEEDELMERTWVRDVVTFREGGELMGKVSGLIRGRGYRVVGLEYGIERDAYILFYEMFKRLNPGVEVKDISGIVAELRMIKDTYELEAIRKAGEIASKVMEKVLQVIKPGITETEIAAEAYYHAYRLGAEEPHVHVVTGPNPRVHAEPFRDARVVEGTAVTVVLGVDHNHYYANMTRTVLVGSSERGRKALDTIKEAYAKAAELTGPGVRPADVMKELDALIKKRGLSEEAVTGYLHGVGLQVEEPPITTIVPQHRFIKLAPGMAIAFIHAPLLVKGVGQVKHEDTFIVTEDGLEPVTAANH